MVFLLFLRSLYLLVYIWGVGQVPSRGVKSKKLNGISKKVYGMHTLMIL